MTRTGIQEETLQAMLEGGAVREVLVSRHNEKWTLAIRLGGLNVQEFLNKSQFRIIVLYAVNELRSKGSHIELAVLPHWD